jgi:hypothetical protein
VDSVVAVDLVQALVVVVVVFKDLEEEVEYLVWADSHQEEHKMLLSRTKSSQSMEEVAFCRQESENEL